MSEPDVEIVKKTAALARLQIEEDEAQQLAVDFARILSSFERLAEVDVEGAEEMTGPGHPGTVLRADSRRPSLSPDELLAAAPAREDDFFKVPKTVGGDA